MKIVWTRLALSDLDAAYNYIAANNPSAAVDTIDRIEKAVNTLSQYPEIGRSGRIPGTKEMVVTRTPFLLPYRVQGEQIEILAVIHAARQWPESF
jgi:toxin ParE1/3/4